MFKKILIANRGEIACRIIKTARRLGIETIAVYSTADSDSLHVALADSAFCIGQAAASDSYLNIDHIIKAALASGAEAIHPGYGFLSENPEMARACIAAGIIFIGPSVAAMEAMASKQLAKQMLEKTSVPLTPGYHGNQQKDDHLLLEAKKIGFPILLKAACGGGGKGMRTVLEETDFFQALASARREAKASFADDTMLIEKLISHPRHIEIQIMADNYGNVVHLLERDCSIQRRHQKIIEEAPAPHLSKPLRKKLADAAIAVAHAIDYRGAGTVEFLVEDDHFYFMEMNTRLQVEHPVTEMITGLDLVEWQLRIAANEPLPKTQEQIHGQGHAIECRIYAEDPYHDFVPSIGHIHFLKEPTGEDIRLDTGIVCGSQITMHYDPMIAKLIAWGDSREQALLRLQVALKHYHIGGVKTNIPFLQAIIKQPNFIKAQLSTNFLSEQRIDLAIPDKRLAVLAAAAVDYSNLVRKSKEDMLLRDTFSWQLHLSSHWCSRYWINGEQYELSMAAVNDHELTLHFNNETIQLQLKLLDNQLEINDGKQSQHLLIEQFGNQLMLYTELGPIAVERFDWQHLAAQHNQLGGQLTAPMHATIVAILKNKGDNIKAGDSLIVLEAMKMEHTIHAPRDGVLGDIFYEVGAQVNEGAELVTLQADKQGVV